MLLDSAAASHRAFGSLPPGPSAPRALGPRSPGFYERGILRDPGRPPKPDLKAGALDRVEIPCARQEELMPWVWRGSGMGLSACRRFLISGTNHDYTYFNL
jgi:hypothetical protein